MSREVWKDSKSGVMLGHSLYDNMGKTSTSLSPILNRFRCDISPFLGLRGGPYPKAS